MATGHRAATRSVLEGHEHAGTLTQIEMSGTGMDANTVLALGLGVTQPWRLVNQRLETGKQPHELHLEVAAAGYPPESANWLMGQRTLACRPFQVTSDGCTCAKEADPVRLPLT